MKVQKRVGWLVPVKFDRILQRVEKQTAGLSKLIDPPSVSQKVISYIVDGITTVELDRLLAETASMMVTVHPDYSKVAARIALTSLHKQIEKSFSKTVERLYSYTVPETGERAPVISEDVYRFVAANAERLDAMVDLSRDLKNYGYFGYKTLEKSYLLRINGEVVESPQYMLMRVAVGLHYGDTTKTTEEILEEIEESYNMTSDLLFTHATPTLYNASTATPQLASCFLMKMDDSLESIFDILKEAALISKSAGGIGIAIHEIRGLGAYIKGSNGYSNGIVPMLQVYNATARYVDQSGRRKGSIAMYLEPWHCEVEAFLELRENTGKEELRTRDLFTAMWIPDLFFKRVLEGGDWTLFSPDEAPGLSDVYDEYDNPVFTELYERYEREGRGRKTMPAEELFKQMYNSAMNTGTPYMLAKDAVNRQSNQKNAGVIKSSNLCTEILEYTSDIETAVCNLASINLKAHLIPKKGIDHEKLLNTVRRVVKNLNRTIDATFYPSEKARYSNNLRRPIGIGIQGLADVFAILKLPFTSPEAKKINREMMETIYFGALTESMELAKKHGAYASFEGSPLSKGLFHFDMARERNIKITKEGPVIETETTVVLSGMHDWETLRADVMKYGVRNSLLVAPMPTASTASIMDNNECFEAFTSNLYTRSVLSGKFVVVNPYMVEDLVKLGLWDEEMKNHIIANDGSVQNIEAIPADVKELYRTAYELKLKDQIDMQADRGYFIDQSQSMNLWFPDQDYSKYKTAILYSWAKGNKTLMYYARVYNKVGAIKGLGIAEKPKVADATLGQYRVMLERAQAAAEEDEGCEMCSA